MLSALEPDGAAFGCRHHLRDLRFLAELRAMRLRGAGGGLHVALGIRHLATLLVADHARCAADIALTGTFREDEAKQERSGA